VFEKLYNIGGQGPLKPDEKVEKKNVGGRFEEITEGPRRKGKKN